MTCADAGTRSSPVMTRPNENCSKCGDSDWSQCGVIKCKPFFSCSQALCDQLPDLGALGSGALILEGMFDDTLSDVHLSRTAEFRTRVAQVQHVLTESNKMGE